MEDKTLISEARKSRRYRIYDGPDLVHSMDRMPKVEEVWAATGHFSGTVLDAETGERTYC